MLNKSKFLIALPIFIFLVALVATPIIPNIMAATQDFYWVHLHVGNDNATITWVYPVNATPIDDSTTEFVIMFNVTDANGYIDINMSTITVTVDYNGVNKTVTGDVDCAKIADDDANTATYECNVTMEYFDDAGNWSMNISVTDNAAEKYAYNDTEYATYNYLYAMKIDINDTYFTGTAGTENVAANPQPEVRNTGNGNFTTMNITAFDLKKSGAEVYVAATNISVNTTNSDGVGAGIVMANNTMKNIPDSELVKRTYNTWDNTTLYHYIDIPAGTHSGDYNSTAMWKVDAIQ